VERRNLDMYVRHLHLSGQEHRNIIPININIKAKYSDVNWGTDVAEAVFPLATQTIYTPVDRLK
jgi:hypothetical protein